MEIKNAINHFILTLDNKEQATFIIKGNGPYICYIMGSGSFYLNGLTGLEDKLTLVTCDGLWSKYKTEPTDEEKIKSTTLEALLTREKFVIKKIKEHFGCSKICLMGFSSPAALAFKYALDNPHDIACVIGTGAGLCKLDQNFNAADELFEYKFPERFKEFKDAETNYSKIVKNEADANPLKDDNFIFDNEQKRRLTPNSDYIEQVRYLLTKLVHDRKYEPNCYNHWKVNSIGQVVSQQMRAHFFNAIQPKLDTLLLLEELDVRSNIPILLIHGEYDFITPLTNEIQKRLEQYKNIKFNLYLNCAHMTYIENNNKYSEDLISFISKNAPMKTLNITDEKIAKLSTASVENTDQFESQIKFTKK